MMYRLAGAAAVAVLCLAALPDATRAQGTPPPAAQPQQPASAPAEPQSEAKGKVIFSRSLDENGEPVTQTGPAIAQPEITNVSQPAVEDAVREAVTLTSLDLEVHLRTGEQKIAVRALLAVRNSGKSPLSKIPLQISSSLNWESIRVEGVDVAFTVAPLNSDTDHTGQLHEAAVPLAEPLAPNQSIRLDVTYSGSIAVDAKRLLAVGTPDDAAIRSDWDRVSAAFTGLRGFGNVVWYPVSSVPAILGDGARVFDEIGRQKLRMSGAKFRLRLAVEYPAGQAPNVALIDGMQVPLAGGTAEGSETSGVETADSGETTLGFSTPSLFVAMRKPAKGSEMSLFVVPEDAPAVDAWTAAEKVVTPFLQGWLGKHPEGGLTVLDLPEAKDAPFETGALLALPVRSGPADALEGVLAHALSHAYLNASGAPLPMWLDEGVANFMGTLWIERQQGREKALETLESSRPALALAEPSSPGESTGEPLDRAASPVYYRTKAAYVLWMLRDIAGEAALSAALRGIEPEARSSTAMGSEGGAGKNRLFEKLLEQADGKDLSWFFTDWVDADHGLPDLAIEGVFPTTATPDSSLVAINMANTGYAAAEVPVTVESDLTSVTQRILIPARGKVSRRILIQGKPISVQLNDGATPETQASVHVTKLSDAAAQPDAPDR